MREAFEKHFPIPHSIYWDEGVGKYRSHFGDYGYFDEKTAQEYNQMLKVWEVAHESILIEIPPEVPIIPIFHERGRIHNDVLSRCKTSIEQAGVKWK